MASRPRQPGAGTPWGPVEALSRADDESFLHGVAHVGAGRVTSYDDDGNAVAAVVADGGSRRVHWGVAESTCSCPRGSGSGSACEHQVAVALAWLHHRRGIEMNDLVAAWFDGTLAGLVASTPWSAQPIEPDEPADEGEADPAIARFLGGLDAGQLRGLLLALSCDLPEVADILAALAGSDS